MGLFFPEEIRLPIPTNLFNYISTIFYINNSPNILCSLLSCMFIRPIGLYVKYYESHGNDCTLVVWAVLGFYQFNKTFNHFSMTILQFKYFHNINWCLLDFNQTNDKWLIITAHVRIPVDMIGSNSTNSTAHPLINMPFHLSHKGFL